MKSITDPQTGEITQLLDENGWEIPDPTPLRIPSGFKRPETLAEQVKRLVRNEQFQQAMADQGNETFEDSEDFDVDDDFDVNTPYETFFDPTLGREITPEEFQRHKETYKKRYLKAQEDYYDQIDAENIMAENLARARAREKAATQPGVRGADPLAGPAPSSGPGTGTKRD